MSARTTAVVGPYQSGKILVESATLGSEETAFPNLPIYGPLGLIFTVIGHFGVHGIRLSVNSEVPPKSGLGGSSALTVAVIGALQGLRSPPGESGRNLHRTVQLAHQLEDSLYNNTGLQDQAAAAYGGVHLWEWRFGAKLDFAGQILLDNPDELSPHILVGYSGKPHTSNQGSVFLEKFKQTGNFAILKQITNLAREMGQALRCRDYQGAGRTLAAESDIRSSFMGTVNSPRDQMILDAARDHGCGARFAGHGGGGCVWAIGEVKAVSGLRSEWVNVLKECESGFLFPTGFSRDGLRVARQTHDDSRESNLDSAANRG